MTSLARVQSHLARERGRGRSRGTESLSQRERASRLVLDSITMANFSLNIRLKTQLMNEIHKVKSAEKATEDFFVRRLRLAFQGNVFSKNVKYKVELTAAAAEMGRTDPRTADSVRPRAYEVRQ